MQSNEVAIPMVEIIAAKELIISSEKFSKSPRMRRLLSFLVDSLASEDARLVSEYAIGIEVFDRKADVYNTADDPIARVQVGRLRDKLKSYYESLGESADIEISIPLGSYIPIVRRIHRGLSAIGTVILEVGVINCFFCEKDGVYFTHGLREELVHQLHIGLDSKAPGQIFLITATSPKSEITASASLAAQRLEGSVRIDEERIRASMRLVNPSEGRVIWSNQFDCNISTSIAQQEELARSICSELEIYFLKG